MIELTVKDLELSEQRITDRCGEFDFQLSNHRDWNQPNPRLHQDICDLLPILYQSGFDTEGFPNLEQYLYETRFVAVSIIITFSIRLCF